MSKFCDIFMGVLLICAVIYLATVALLSALLLQSVCWLAISAAAFLLAAVFVEDEINCRAK